MITLILDKLLIKYASPTLGGIKTGSLFKVYKSSCIDLKKEIEKKQKVSLDYAETLSENKMLDMLIKGINEKIINAKKRRTFIESEIIKIKNEIDSSNTSIQFLYQQANYKVASVQNEKEQISSFTKKEVDMIKEQIQKEKEINAQLKSDISDIEYRRT